VFSWCQNLCFPNFDLHRYNVELIGVKGSTDEPEMERADMMYEERIERVKQHREKGNVVGLCALNQVDPLPITYSLSNP
jgi:hypothetical protein